MTPGDGSAHLRLCLDRLRAGDATARDELLAHAADRLRRLTRKLLRDDFDRLRRWEETDDVFQNAAVRLCRALGDVVPATPLEFFRLAAAQIRRELLDLARHHTARGAGAPTTPAPRAATRAAPPPPPTTPTTPAAWPSGPSCTA